MMIQYDAATGLIVAWGQFDAAPDGLLLGYVLAAAPLALPGRKFLRLGRVEVEPPPEPTAEEVAAREAEAAQDREAGDRLRAAVASLRDAEAALAAGTVTTLAGLRPIVLLIVRVQLAQLRLWARRGA